MKPHTQVPQYGVRGSQPFNKGENTQNGSNLKYRDLMESMGLMGWDQHPVERIITSQYFKHGLSPLYHVPSDKQGGVTIGVSFSSKIIINLKF